MNIDMNRLLKEINTETFLKDEISGTIESLRKKIDEKYIKRIKNTINTVQKESVQTPTKEAGLLMAMREFSSEIDRERFDKAIDIFNRLNTLSNIQKDMNEFHSNNKLYSLSDENPKTDTSSSLFNTLLLLSFMNII